MAGPAYFDAFRRITVQPDNVTVTADAVNDQLTLTAGTGISLVANATNDSITIVNSGPSAPTLDQVLSFGAVSTQTATFGGLVVDGQNITANSVTNWNSASDWVQNFPSGTIQADISGSVFANDSTRIINGIDGTVTTPTANIGDLTFEGKNISLSVPDANKTIFISGGSGNGGVLVSNNLGVIGAIGRIDANTYLPIALSLNSPTGNSPVNTSTPSEWMQVVVNGNTRYIPLYT